MEIYVGVIEKGCVGDTYTEIVYVGFDVEKAKNTVNRHECNFGMIQMWKDDKFIKDIKVK